MSKVLFTGLSSNLGGIEVFIFNYFTELRKHGLNMGFLVGDNTVCFEEEIIKNGGLMHRLKYHRNKTPFKYYIELIRFFKKNPDYNIVHVNLQSASSIAPVIIAKLFGRTVFAHSHNSKTPSSKITKLLDKINKPILRKICNGYFGCAYEAGVWMFGEKIAQSSKFTVLSNAIDIEKFKFNEKIREKIRVKLGIQHNFVLGHVGRFSEAKNHSYLIEIFKIIHDQDASFRLLLIGDGPLKKDMENKVLSLQLEDKVIFLGVRSDVEDLYQAMDMLVFPSIYEGFPIVLTEAQANGLKCIISDTITDEINFTGTIKALSINENPNIWAKFILANKIQRTNQGVGFDNSYNIKDAAKILLEIYKRRTGDKL